MSSSTQQILARQRRWAQGRGLEVDGADRVVEPGRTLFAPLSPAAHEELSRGAARPLGEGGEKPAPIQALHSKTALVCNVFEPWRDRDLGPLAGALGSCARSATRLELLRPIGDAALPEGSRPVEADVWLDGNGVRPTALFASFCEPYSDPDPRLTPGLADCDALWRLLPGCRGLAHDVRFNARRWARLEVGRMLERALVLSRRHGVRGFRMLYLWWDEPGAEAQQLAREIDRARMRMGGEVDFVALRWQTLFTRLANAPSLPASRYTADLSDRYF